MRVNNVKASRVDQGVCGFCREPLPAGTPYRWTKARYGPKKVRCMKPQCAFRNSDLTSNEKLSRAYAAGESVEDALLTITMAVHVKQILEQCQTLSNVVEEAMSELEEAAMEFEESADNIEEYFSESEQAEESRERAYEIEDWRTEFETAKDQLDGEIESLEKYIEDVDRYRDEHAIPDDADIIITNMEGFMSLVADEEGNLEPFDTSEIEEAISQLQDATTSCPF